MRQPLFLAALLTTALACAGGGTERTPRPLASLGQEHLSHAQTILAAAIVPTATAETPPLPAPAAVPAPVRHAAKKAPASLPPLSKMRLLQEDSTPCPSQALGVVTVHAENGEETAGEDRLRAKAERLGADTIVGYRSSPDDKGTGKDLTGLAVHCAKLTEDRPYEVLRTFEVPATPGEEDLAFQELRAKAQEIGADLVTEIQVLPNADGTGSRVVGSAIKYPLIRR
jgi:uncharacterized protein YbjQ (UPF0145 family)